MRRRHFVAKWPGPTPITPPPLPTDPALKFNFATNSQYVPLISF